MAGAFYIWIMGAVFLFVVGFVLVLGGMIWVGHWMHKRETGAKEGFLELPEELRPKANDEREPQMNADER